MTIEINKNDIQDRLLQGINEAAEREVEILRAEGYPIWTWRDDKVVDATEEITESMKNVE